MATKYKHISNARLIAIQEAAEARGDLVMAALCETAIFGAAYGRDNYPEGFALIGEDLRSSDRARAFLAIQV
jgi:hypothetical protein